jgi:hypothetical protein
MTTINGKGVAIDTATEKASTAEPQAHGAPICGVCGQLLRGKQQTACSAACRAKASRLRNPDPAAVLRHALRAAPKPLNPASYTEADSVAFIRIYAAWYTAVRALAPGKRRPSS